MTRGETAQLIWDMLNTQIAITDPLTGDLIYPGMEDSSPYGLLLGPGKIKRETYLENPVLRPASSTSASLSSTRRQTAAMSIPLR